MRFNIALSSAGDTSINADDASLELEILLRRHFSNYETDHDKILDCLLDHSDDTGRVYYQGFKKAFIELKSEISGSDDISGSGAKKVPIELRTRFRSASHPKTKLLKKVAKRVLSTLYEQSELPVTESKLSFTRSKSKWNDKHVSKLLDVHQVEPKYIDEDGFVAVGMKILFK